jgi:plastocyanin
MMRIPFARSQYSWLLAALAIACALFVARSDPARAFPTAATFTASDSLTWTAGTGGSSVHIDPGGVVSFSYPSGFSSHNVDFGATPPTSCAQTAPTAGNGQPMPAAPSSSGWAGSCTFADTGKYTFYCDLHTGMRGTVLVGDVPEPTPPTGGGGGGGGTGGTQNGGGYLPAPLAGLKIAKTQRGVKVGGSIADLAAGSDLKIDITAKSSALKTSASIRVGRLTKSSLAAGTYKFSIKLNSKARAAIKKKGKLAVSVKFKLTPPGAPTVTATRSVTLKKR